MKDLEAIPDRTRDLCGAVELPLPPKLWRSFRKKPIEVQAYQFSVEMLEAHLFDGAPLPEGLLFGSATYHKGRRELVNWRISVMTAHEQRVMLADGDWVVPEPVPNRFYPIKPDIFAATYEPADAARSASPLLTAEEGPGCKPPTSS